MDFCIVKDGEVEELVEAKLSDTNVSLPLQYYAQRLMPQRALQIVAELKKPYSKGKIAVETAIDALSSPNI